MKNMIERRFFPTELRIQKDDEPTKMVGYVAVFDKWSEDLGGFREKIAPGAFSKTIKEADIRALWNHDSNIVLGRNKSNTLTLKEDKKGLAVEILAPEWAGNYLETIERGDVDGMSFGFNTIKDKWENSEGKESKRTLLEVELFDVSPVTFPAYPQTDINVRTFLAEAGIDFDALSLVFIRSKTGDVLRNNDFKLIKNSIEVLNGLIEPGQGSHSEDKSIPRLSILKKRLELVAKAI